MTASIPGGVGPVETRFFTFAEDEPFLFKSGQSLGPLKLAYEVYGELNAAADNAVLLLHALTGTQHAAGYNPAVAGVGDLWTEECSNGWWDRFIGPGRALDTDRLCVICANYIGGCYGSTGPAATDPAASARLAACPTIPSPTSGRITPTLPSGTTPRCIERSRWP